MVRPVELQDVFAKTQAAERITQLQKAQPENQQRQAAAETTQKSQEHQRKPVKSTHADEVVLHREKDQKDKKKKKKKNGESEELDGEASNESGDTQERIPDDDGSGDLTANKQERKSDHTESTGLDIVV
jgi:hypothetical protein